MSAMSVTPESAQFGVIGLGVMGENLALNIEDHGYTTSRGKATTTRARRDEESSQ